MPQRPGRSPALQQGAPVVCERLGRETASSFEQPEGDDACRSAHATPAPAAICSCVQSWRRQTWFSKTLDILKSPLSPLRSSAGPRLAKGQGHGCRGCKQCHGALPKESSKITCDLLVRYTDMIYVIHYSISMYMVALSHLGSRMALVHCCSKVTVAVRMRPMSAKELNEGGEICVQVLSKEAQARCEALIWV